MSLKDRQAARGWSGERAVTNRPGGGRARRCRTCVGLLAQAAISAAHARAAEHGEWALSEKGITRRAGLGTKVASTLAAAGDRPFELSRSVAAMRVALRSGAASS